MKKALIVTTVSGFVPQFEMDNVKLLKSMGYEVHYAANYNMPVYSDNNNRLNDLGIIQHQIDFVRSPYWFVKNILAYNQLSRLLREISFDIVHCHTPMGGVLTRLAANKNGTVPLIYTAHGFHFYSGAPIKNWILYYSIENMLAHMTDILITINQEDYKRAMNFRLRKGGQVIYIPGVGLNIRDFSKEFKGKNDIRKKLGVADKDFLIISVGELTKGKNHLFSLKVIRQLREIVPRIKYVICGTGKMKNKLQSKIEEYDLQNNVILAGYRTDIKEILMSAECFLFPSIREGLSVALMEAMAAGLPVVCAEIRGNVDLIENSKGGYLIRGNKLKEYVNCILDIYEDENKQKNMGKWNQKRIQEFRSEKVRIVMKEIYNYKKC